jgi:hypothetical protein
MRSWFKEKPSLEDWIAAHNPTSTAQVELLEYQYFRFMNSKNYWGEVI